MGELTAGKHPGLLFILSIVSDSQSSFMVYRNQPNLQSADIKLHAENCSWPHRDVPAHHCHGCFINVNIMHVHFWRSCCCSAVQKHSAGQWLQGCCLLHSLQPRPAEMLLLLNTNHAFVCFVSWAAAHMREKLRCTCGLTPAWGCFRGMTLTGKATAINTLLLITLGFV